MNLPFLDAESLLAALPMPAAIDALEQALLAGLDPAVDPPRTVVGTEAGQVLVMPSAAGSTVAVKLVSVAPGNSGRGLPLIQGVVVLFDPATLTPVALIDGSALTALRTPAVSAVAVRHLAAARAHRLVVFGSGPQAEGHITAIRAVRPIDEVVLIGRDRARTQAVAARVAAPGLLVRIELMTDTGPAVGVGPGVGVGPAAGAGPVSRGRDGTDAGWAEDVAQADVVVCATSARSPLFEGRLIRDGCCVVAVGSHEPTAREVDAVLVHRSRVIVEETTAALREAGDLVLAGVRPDQVLTLAEVVRHSSEVPSGPPDLRPTLVKTVGMAWEDAVVAGAAITRWLAGG